ncbi:MAG: GntR family transcriptional regulator [Rudaea sp.]|uniref:GntR family transcriptional regulator n=1 Tax=Rudaea sp. TaxID=2136325 RepID=UPI0039E69EEB
MDASLFLIRAAAPEPIYRQIVGQLRRMIASGQLRPGDTLPSVREVAGFHAINPMTVSRAYCLLEAEGALARLRGKGMAVAAAHRRAQSEDKRLQLIEPHLRDIARQARELELSSEPVLRRLGELLENEE